MGNIEDNPMVSVTSLFDSFPQQSQTPNKLTKFHDLNKSNKQSHIGHTSAKDREGPPPNQIAKIEFGLSSHRQPISHKVVANNQLNSMNMLQQEATVASLQHQVDSNQKLTNLIPIVSTNNNTVNTPSNYFQKSLNQVNSSQQSHPKNVQALSSKLMRHNTSIEFKTRSKNGA